MDRTKPMRPEQVEKMINEVRRENVDRAIGKNLQEFLLKSYEDMANAAINKFLVQFQVVLRLHMARVLNAIQKNYNAETDELTDELIKIIESNPYSLRR